jgi:GTP-dependent phosphoenolpyruvate carboxykinase
MDQLLEVRSADWKEELADHRKFFAKFGGDLPKELGDQTARLEARLSGAVTSS